MTLKEYIAELNWQYQTGQAREHSYRPALQRLLAEMLPQLTVVNEPARTDCGEWEDSVRISECRGGKIVYNSFKYL